MEVGAQTQEKFEKILKLPKAARMGILIGIGALICTAYYFGFYQDAAAELERLRSQELARLPDP